VVQGIKRGQTTIDPEPSTVTERDDIFILVAQFQDHEAARDILGPEVLDRELIDYTIDSCDVVITNDEATGMPIGELGLTKQHGCFPIEIIRSQIHLPPDPHTTLAKGDTLRISGERRRLAILASNFGHVERNIQETDLLTFAFGIAAGILAGTIMVKLGGINIGVGSAGGLLLTGILIGYLRSIHPTFGRVPPAARYIFMELGLMFFMVSIGLRAGGGIVEALLSVGPTVLICGMIVTITPVVVGYVFGTYVLKLNPVMLLGAITGAMTSTPSLNIVTQAARSSLPRLGYAGTCAWRITNPPCTAGRAP
jgi:putative transport protein